MDNLSGCDIERAITEGVRQAFSAFLLRQSAVDTVPAGGAELSVDRVAEDGARILKALREARPDGLSRTSISSLFGNHAPRARIAAVLGHLEDTRHVTREKICRTDGKPGRPRTLFHLRVDDVAEKEAEA